MYKENTTSEPGSGEETQWREMRDPVQLVIVDGKVLMTNITKDHQLRRLDKGHNLKQQRLIRP